MSKEARYLIRLAHAGNVQTGGSSRPYWRKVRDIVQPLNGKAINLRVSRRALEFDLFCSPETELHPFLTALEPLGAVLTYKRLDLPPPVPVPAQVIAEARERSLMRNATGKSMKCWKAYGKRQRVMKNACFRALILTAAALVHVQKNELNVVGPMLEDAAHRLENQPAIYYGLDVRRFLRELKKIIITKPLHFPTI